MSYLKTILLTKHREIEREKMCQIAVINKITKNFKLYNFE